MRTRERARGGFTLIELLVVLSIITTLLGLLAAAIQRSREYANRLQCQHNLRQIGLGLLQYHESCHRLPPACWTRNGGQKFLSWQARMLPWLEQEGLWRGTQAAFAIDGRFWSQAHLRNRTTVVPLYICPSGDRTIANPQPENTFAAVTYYLGVSGARDGSGVLFMNSQVRFGDVIDGTSNTLLVGERPPSCDDHFGWWYAGVGQINDGSLDTHLATIQYNQTFRAPTCPNGPYTYQSGSSSDLCDMFHFWSHHPGGANFLFADGSVHFVPYSGVNVLSALATRGGGEVAGL